MRPNSEDPWVADDDMIQTVSIKLTESPLDDPVYVNLIKLEALENVEKIRVRLVKDGVEETVRVEEVRPSSIH